MDYKAEDINLIIEQNKNSSYRIAKASLFNSTTGKNDIIWIKRIDESQLTLWHVLQNIITKLIPLKIIRTTVSYGGDRALIHEKNTIEKFKKAQINVPKIIYADNNIIITKDLGESLYTKLSSINENEDKARYSLINKATKELIKIHSNNLCHSRPYIKDITIDENGNIGFLDFEEDPLAVMPLDIAQMRDIWLFSLSVSDFIGKEMLDELIIELMQGTTNIAKIELKRFIKIIHYVSKLARLLKIKGKDVERLTKANLSFETYFKL